MKKTESLYDIYEKYGEDNVVPITALKQALTYIAKFKIQPVWVDESCYNEGKVVFFFEKSTTKEAYDYWMKNRPQRRDN